MQTDTDNLILAKSFDAFVPLSKAVEGEDGRRIVNGVPGLIEQEDYDEDILGLAGMEKAIAEYPVKFGGHVDWDHQYDRTKNAQWIIGKAIQTARVNGLPNLATELFIGNPHADNCWDLHENRKASLGYSLKGLLKARDPRNKKRITDLEIHMVTIAPTPKGYGGTRIHTGLPENAEPLGTLLKAHAFALAHDDFDGWQPMGASKALTTGDGQVLTSDTGGRAMRRESLASGVSGEQCRCPDCRCKNRKSRDKCRACGASFQSRKASKAIFLPAQNTRLVKAVLGAGISSRTNAANIAAYISQAR